VRGFLKGYTMLNAKEVGKILNIHPQTIKVMRNKGLLPPHYKPTPCRWVWNEKDIELFAKCRNMDDYNKRVLA
jgi:DNA-binding transcriptional MerR regulator